VGVPFPLSPSYSIPLCVQVGTPYCITVDFQTLEDDTVTLRERDTTEQRRVSVTELLDYMEEQIDA
jgi:glycyl-tRNA synthetase